MQIVTVDPHYPKPKTIERIVQVLREGGLVIYPSDTCYGIAADPTNPIAMQKLYDLKQRDLSKGISLLVPNLDYVDHLAVTDARIKRILEDHLPGPYSFLLVNSNFAYCPLPTVVIRLPNFPLTLAIADYYGLPYTTTSANISGEPPAYSMTELENALLDPETLTTVPDLVLDGGNLPHNPPSTIVDLTHWPPKIIRQGAALFTWEDYD